MKKILFTIIPLLLLSVSCKNKELSAEDPCRTTGFDVLVRMNWDDHQRDSRTMRMSLFSRNDNPHYDRESVDKSGRKTMKLPLGCCYAPICYDYYARNVYFRNETTCEQVEAYSAASTRTTYVSRAEPVDDETTVSEPGNFYMDAWDGTFDIVDIPGEGEQLVIDFYPQDVMREFTFRINNVMGAKNIADARGAVSGMSASILVLTRQLSDKRSTVLFENAKASNEEVGYIEGKFYTFGPLEPYSNRFTIEVMSRKNQYFTSYWDVSGQIAESMADRAAKLARDKYDILIDNDPNKELPPIPGDGDPDPGSGFDINVDEWDDVTIYL